jgi:hypothetical protein
MNRKPTFGNSSESHHRQDAVILIVNMAKSRYEYVKLFEKDDTLLPNTWIVVRIDGKAFHGYLHWDL